MQVQIQQTTFVTFETFDYLDDLISPTKQLIYLPKEWAQRLVAFDTSLFSGSPKFKTSDHPTHKMGYSWVQNMREFPETF